MTLQEIVRGLNKISGHEKRGFSDLEFALACIRDPFTLKDPEFAFGDNGEDGTNESEWAMFYAGYEFFCQLAKCFIDKKEPDYKKIFEEVCEQLNFSIGQYKSNKEETNG